MSAIAARIRITPQALGTVPDAKNYELVDGELVERHASIRSSTVAAMITRLLDAQASRTKEARVFANDLGYQCYPRDPDQIRKPDVSVVRSPRLAGIDVDKGHMPVHADLVVEVISPSDLDYAVVEKIREYLAAGFPLIWFIRTCAP